MQRGLAYQWEGLDADTSIELSWARHRETQVVMRLDLDPCGGLWELRVKGNDAVGRGIQGRKEKSSRMHVVHVLDRDFLRRGAWGTVNLRGLHDGSILKLALTSSEPGWQSVDMISPRHCDPLPLAQDLAGVFYPLSDFPPARPCRPVAPSVDDISQLPGPSHTRAPFRITPCSLKKGKLRLRVIRSSTKLQYVCTRVCRSAWLRSVSHLT